MLRKAQNFDEVLQTGLLHYRHNSTDGSCFIQCLACREFLNTNKATTGDNTWCEGVQMSLSTGYHIKKDVVLLLRNGKCQSWYNFKCKLTQHISGLQSNATHEKAMKYKESHASLVSRSNFVTENIVRAAIRIVQSKGASSHFESKLAYLKANGVDIGNIGYSRYVL